MKPQTTRFWCGFATKAVLAALVSFTGTAARAQLAPVGPFTGQHSETFEGYSSIVPVQCFRPASGVFQGTATLCTYSATTGSVVSGVVARNGGWVQSCSISAFQGTNFVGNATGRLGYIFNGPVGRFGGYFGSNSTTTVDGGGTVEFYDEGDSLIGTASLTLSPCGQSSWNWNGWESTIGIRRIVVYGSSSSGASLTMDSMEYDPYIPPSTGACCMGDGACVVVAAADCGGAYQGDGTSCDGNPCTPPCPGARGDADCSGGIDFFDIDPFLTALFDLAAYQATYCAAQTCTVDVDQSGTVDFFDIDPFLECLFVSCP